jgi:60 kDa SS-A/Ro ribonucleoprotein
MRCVDVAALFAAAILRRNPDSVVIPFDTQAYKVRVDPGDTILSLSERLARYPPIASRGAITDVDGTTRLAASTESPDRNTAEADVQCHWPLRRLGGRVL